MGGTDGRGGGARPSLWTLLRAPVVGNVQARHLGVFIGPLLTVGIAGLFIRRIRASTSAALIELELQWLVSTVHFEIGFGRFVVGYCW